LPAAAFPYDVERVEHADAGVKVVKIPRRLPALWRGRPPDARTARRKVHAVLAKCGVAVPMSDLFGLEGVALLERVTLPAVYRASWAGLTPRHRESDTHVRSPPANNSSWSTTGYATTPSAHRCTTHRPQHRRHEQPESPPIGAGRAGHDPRTPRGRPR
jgi:hypothetical protein